MEDDAIIHKGSADLKVTPNFDDYEATGRVHLVAGSRPLRRNGVR